MCNFFKKKKESFRRFCISKSSRSSPKFFNPRNFAFIENHAFLYAISPLKKKRNSSYCFRARKELLILCLEIDATNIESYRMMRNGSRLLKIDQPGAHSVTSRLVKYTIVS